MPPPVALLAAKPAVGEAEAEAEEAEAEESLPPALCAALALLRQPGEAPRALRLGNCGLRDMHLLPLIDALQATRPG